MQYTCDTFGSVIVTSAVFVIYMRKRRKERLRIEKDMRKNGEENLSRENETERETDRERNTDRVRER